MFGINKVWRSVFFVWILFDLILAASLIRYENDKPPPVKPQAAYHYRKTILSAHKLTISCVLMFLEGDIFAIIPSIADRLFNVDIQLRAAGSFHVFSIIINGPSEPLCQNTYLDHFS